ncbi:MAG: class I SAM-dependent methyltransferase [bacterium]|nr:class I SAM-dependent methyltransferase [bacterium]
MDEKTAKRILDLTAASYEKIAPQFSATRHYPWDDLLPLTKIVRDGMSLLDVGCGNGRLLSLFKEKEIQYMGVDRSRGLITEAHKAFEGDQRNPLFLEGDILSLDTIPKVKEQQFDIVASVAVLNHIPTHELQMKAVRQLYTILKEGGTLCITTWNLWRPTVKQKSVWKYGLERYAIADQEWERQYGFSKKELGIKDVMTVWHSGITFAPLYYYSFTLHELAMLCTQAGFIVKDTYYSSRGKRAHWWNGKNIIIIAKK